VRWLQDHAWLLIDVGRGVCGYLDAVNGFGLVERAKITLAFGLPILAVGIVLSALWAAGAAVVAMVRRRWCRWRVLNWRRPF
jgi:hypothetical protein